MHTKHTNNEKRRRKDRASQPGSNRSGVNSTFFKSIFAAFILHRMERVMRRTAITELTPQERAKCTCLLIQTKHENMAAIFAALAPVWDLCDGDDGHANLMNRDDISI
jgi:hypothetical protein